MESNQKRSLFFLRYKKGRFSKVLAIIYLQVLFVIFFFWRTGGYP